MVLSERQFATVLAGLRMFQNRTVIQDAQLSDYFSDQPLNTQEIDNLCEDLTSNQKFNTTRKKAISARMGGTSE